MNYGVGEDSWESLGLQGDPTLKEISPEYSLVIKYNLLDVNSLTNHEKYLYSLDEGITNGVLVSSVHYLNYIIGGLNQGMVILKVNNVKVDNKYELDNELGKYLKGSKVTILIKTIHNTYRNYRIKL